MSATAATFEAMAAVCENVARWNSRLKKIAIVGNFLKELDDADLSRTVRFLCCGPVFESNSKRLSIGHATMREALINATGFPDPLVAVCYHECGDSGETISRLLYERSRDESLPLFEAERWYARLFKCRRTADKVTLLTEIFGRYQPLAIKYFIKVITGNLRIGLLERTLEEAVAVATGVPHDVVRLANNRVGDLPRIALAARHGTLDEIEARLFHPMDFMLAKPLESLDQLAEPGAYWVEDKYDGIRSQVHVENGEVRIFSRGMEEVTKAFPELVESLRKLPGSAVIDGEILAWEGECSLPFNVLQQRIARKSVAASLMEKVPVIFMGYDLFYRDGKMLIDTPLEERRAALESLLTNPPERVRIAPQMTAQSNEDIDRHFGEARARCNEGLILKRRGSLYEPGRRSGTWYKVKRAYGTLDVVVTAAEQGHGRRAVLLSDYTFAVRAGDQFVNVGKAYSGLTDVEVRQLTRIFRALATGRYGRTTAVKPEIVLEVAFDGVQLSPRHKSGYALRFPRILRWRKDKKPEESDTIDEVKALYEASLQR